MKRATAYLRRDRLILLTMSKTTDGLSTSVDTPVVLSTIGASPDTVGKALQAALANSKVAVPHPTMWKDHNRDLYQVVGVKNWSAFAKGTRSCSVEEESETIFFEPEAYREDHKGFVQLPGSNFRISRSASPSEIGQALIRALHASIPNSESSVTSTGQEKAVRSVIRQAKKRTR